MDSALSSGDGARVGRRVGKLVIVGTAAAVLAACATAPPPRPAPPPPAPVVNTTVYAYPTQGQTAEQQDRDHYECYTWATQQTGFDPSSASVPPQMRVRVVGGPPPGTGTAVGALSGAAIGAAVSAPWARGPGALFGALVGAAIGSSADASNAAANAQRSQEAYNYNREQYMQLQQRASDYRRALGACLEGRGYNVR
jgi:Glycine zipper 2TM domain